MAKPAKKIVRYKILGELGRCAMGVVYKAEDPNLDRTVALKTISLEKDAEGRAEYHKRFMLEAKAAGKLSHPNIVPVHDFGEVDGLAYMAMELIDGADLRKRVQQGAIPAVEAVEIACQVAEGLAFANLAFAKFAIKPVMRDQRMRTTARTRQIVVLVVEFNVRREFVV